MDFLRCYLHLAWPDSKGHEPPLVGHVVGAPSVPSSSPSCSPEPEKRRLQSRLGMEAAPQPRQDVTSRRRRCAAARLEQQAALLLHCGSGPSATTGARQQAQHVLLPSGAVQHAVRQRVAELARTVAPRQQARGVARARCDAFCALKVALSAPEDRAALDPAVGVAVGLGCGRRHCCACRT